jgi:hypothetical protein
MLQTFTANGLGADTFFTFHCGAQKLDPSKIIWHVTLLHQL